MTNSFTNASNIAPLFVLYRYKVYPVIPPKVEYGLTSLGSNLKTILDKMADFGDFYKSQI